VPSQNPRFPRSISAELWQHIALLIKLSKFALHTNRNRVSRQIMELSPETSKENNFVSNEPIESDRALVKTIKDSVKKSSNKDGNAKEIVIPIISPKLRVITLPEYGLQEKEIYILVRSIVESPFMRLNILKFSHNPAIGKSELFFQFLGKNATIKKLYLESVKLFYGVQFLSNAISTNTTLSSLYLRSNYLREEGIKILSEGLIKNESLTKLCLKENGLSSESCPYITQYLSNNTTLRALNLSNNYFAIGSLSISESLTKNTTLKSLNLSSIGISHSDIFAFTNFILQNTRLQNLDLSNNWNLGTISNQYLNLLSSNSLKKLNLSYCNILRQKPTLEECFKLQNNTSLQSLEVLNAFHSSTIQSSPFILPNYYYYY
jgi:hypothetical protein